VIDYEMLKGGKKIMLENSLWGRAVIFTFLKEKLSCLQNEMKGTQCLLFQ